VPSFEPSSTTITSKAGAPTWPARLSTVLVTSFALLCVAITTERTGPAVAALTLLGAPHRTTAADGAST
jgi:hypothetical protein